MKYFVLIAGLLFACSGDDNNTRVDAGPRPDAPVTCPPQTAPLSPGMHKLYVSTEGVTITLGACDDARTNCSSLVTQDQAMIPAFLPGDTSRTARITAIVAMAQEALAPFSVDVVTTRPASGTYHMVSLGGASTLATGDELLAVKPVCDATNTSPIAFVFEQDDATYSDRAYADTIAGAFGRLVGLVPTTRSGDCMCTQTTCTHLQTCTWGTTAVTPSGNPCMRTSQNEHELMMDAVGCR